MLKRIFLSLAVCLGLTSLASAQEFLSGIKWPEPKVVTPGEKPSDPPSDAKVLIGSEGMSAWNGGDQWEFEDGVATAAKGGIATKEKFGDIQVHLEWAAPEKVVSRGQGRGNSGIYFMGKYEIQILDSYNNPTYFDGQAGSVYKQSPPMVNAMKKPGEWNTYDIVFNRPVRNEKGDVIAPARFTVIHNGVLVQNSYPVRGSTNWHKPPAYEPHGETGNISLQFHGNPVKFRNMWVREIEPIEPTFVPEDTEMVRYKAEWSTEKMTAAPPAESEAPADEAAAKKEAVEAAPAEEAPAEEATAKEASTEEAPAEKAKGDKDSK